MSTGIVVPSIASSQVSRIENNHLGLQFTYVSRIVKSKMKLHNFIKVANPFDISCWDEKLEENKRPLLERTADVVTQPSNQVIVLANVPFKQETMGSGLVKTPTPLSFVVSPLHSAATTKASEFVHAFSSRPAKRFKSSVKVTSGGSGVSKKPAAKKGHLVIKHPSYVPLESVIVTFSLFVF
ncbi:hypothetical protein Tco_1384152 [Tanacetum coccineum]